MPLFIFSEHLILYATDGKTKKLIVIAPKYSTVVVAYAPPVIVFRVMRVHCSGMPVAMSANKVVTPIGMSVAARKSRKAKFVETMVGVMRVPPGMIQWIICSLFILKRAF